MKKILQEFSDAKQILERLIDVIYCVFYDHKKWGVKVLFIYMC